jgi:hypothetical protein
MLAAWLAGSGASGLGEEEGGKRVSMLEWEIMGTMRVVPTRRGRPAWEGSWRRPPDTRAPRAVATAAGGAACVAHSRARVRGQGGPRGGANGGWAAQGGKWEVGWLGGLRKQGPFSIFSSFFIYFYPYYLSQKRRHKLSTKRLLISHQPK